MMLTATMFSTMFSFVLSVRVKNGIRNVPTLDRNSRHHSGFMRRPCSFCLGGEGERKGPTETTANLGLLRHFCPSW